ncbi:uncharacterized protein PAC_10815 [Phialocephala subalpina]|uniref:Uncharacterized protein n=1 Tax=Phialocephala subalpina TaxID=576137 RepID=A0A1L7X7B7_9HELO|nr:uncharacterized protein PAC_10815 [Phialocephala subalpina]
MADVSMAQGLLWVNSFGVSARFRDSVAARLLKFADAYDVSRMQNNWSIVYKTLLSNEPQYHPSLPIDETGRYRCEIQHLVIKVCILKRDAEFKDWDWPLKVDWATLPNLKTLCLGLRPYSQRKTSRPFERQRDNEKIARGARRMECLRLKSLIIYGLCSGLDLSLDEQHKQRMDKLFRNALDADGVTEFRGLEQQQVDWTKQ